MAIIDNLISYYKLDDDAANTTVADAHGSNTGTLNGGRDTEDLSVAGKIEKAFSFNGGSDDVLLPISESSGDWSFSFWADHSGDTDHQLWDSTSGRLVISLKRSTSGINNNIGFYDGAWKNFGISADVGTLKHYVFVFDSGNSKAYLYINGVKEAAEPAYSTVSNLGGTTRLAADISGNNEYGGIIDEFGIWGKILNQTEVTALYAGGSGLAYPFSAGPDFSTIKLNIADVFKDAADMFINIGDDFKQVTEVWLNVGDVFIQVV